MEVLTIDIHDHLHGRGMRSGNHHWRKRETGRRGEGVLLRPCLKILQLAVWVFDLKTLLLALYLYVDEGRRHGGLILSRCNTGWAATILPYFEQWFSASRQSLASNLLNRARVRVEEVVIFLSQDSL